MPQEAKILPFISSSLVQIQPAGSCDKKPYCHLTFVQQPLQNEMVVTVKLLSDRYQCNHHQLVYAHRLPCRGTRDPNGLSKEKDSYSWQWFHLWRLGSTG